MVQCMVSVSCPIDMTSIEVILPTLLLGLLGFSGERRTNLAPAFIRLLKNLATVVDRACILAWLRREPEIC